MRRTRSQITYLTHELKVIVRARKNNLATINCRNRNNVLQIDLLNILLQYNLIFGYELNEGTIKIFLWRFTSGIPEPMPFRKVKMLSTVNVYRPISYKQLIVKKKANWNKLYILYTREGLSDDKYASEMKLGGLLLCEICF